jgi:hypothetical protein
MQSLTWREETACDTTTQIWGCYQNVFEKRSYVTMWTIFILLGMGIRGQLLWTWYRHFRFLIFYCYCATAPPPSGPRPPHYWRFLITLRHITLGRTPLDEWLARRRDLYLTTHNIHKIQTSMPPAGFEPAIAASERPQTHALDRAATGIGQLPN